MSRGSASHRAPRRLWTPAEDERLLAMVAARKTHAQMAADLQRPASSIPSRLDTLHIKRDQAQPGTRGVRHDTKQGGVGERRPRNCLCCGKSFLSAHAGNRLCATCRGKSVSPFAF